MKVVPVLYLLLLPLMAAMGDPLSSVRNLASGCFAHVLTLMPLAQGVVLGEVPGMSPA